MPNTRSAKKRLRQNIKRRARNRHWKSTMRTAIKKVRKAVEAKDLELAKEELRKASSIIAKVASKKIIHRNTASRYTSRLYKLVNKLEAQTKE